ncbi:hypothetical protein RUND412_007774 [Rhizina undulata]
MAEPQSNNPFRRSMSPPQGSMHQLSTLSPQESLTAPALSKTHSASTSIPEEPELEAASGTYPPNLQFSNPPGTTITPYPTTLTRTTTSSSTSSTSPMPSPIAAAPPVITDPPKAHDGSIVITIHPTSSASSVPPTQSAYNPPRNSISAHPHPRQSIQVDGGASQCAVWPARRYLQKQVSKDKRLWIAIKVLLVLVFVGGAVAIGLGISKTVNKG